VKIKLADERVGIQKPNHGGQEVPTLLLFWTVSRVRCATAN
jgi:hypothetical protein